MKKELANLLPLLCCCSILCAQGPEKKLLSYENFKEWNSLNAGTKISNNGEWITYSVFWSTGIDEIFAQNTRLKKRFNYPMGMNPQFSANSRFLFFISSNSITTIETQIKLWKDDLGIMDLNDGKTSIIKNASNYKLSQGDEGFFAYLEKDSTNRDNNGEKLVIRKAGENFTRDIEKVSSYFWSPDGVYLVYITKPIPGSSGLSMYNTITGRTSLIFSGTRNPSNCTFSNQNNSLAFLLKDENAFSPADLNLYSFSTGKTEILAKGSDNFLANRLKLSEKSELYFSEDGNRLFFTLFPAEKDVLPEKNRIQVDIWSYKDLQLQFIQKFNATSGPDKSYTYAISLQEKKVVPVENGSWSLSLSSAFNSSQWPPNQSFSTDGRYCLCYSSSSYLKSSAWGEYYFDIALFDCQTETYTCIATKSVEDAVLSPGGKFVVYFDGKDWWSHATSTNRKINLTKDTGIQFSLEERDKLSGVDYYGIAGWLEKDEAVLLYDKYDIWKISPQDGKALKLTNGRGKGIVYRYESCRWEQPEISANTQLVIGSKSLMLLKAIDQNTMSTSYSHCNPLNSEEPVKLVNFDKSVIWFRKAKNAGQYVFKCSRFDEDEDIWTADDDFKNARKISNINPQQNQYNWGNAELINCVSADGKPFKSVLIKPENFDPQKQYPLMVRVYETYSQSLHQYYPPQAGTQTCISQFVSNGYVFLLPDIRFEIGNPVAGAENYVIPAVEQVVGMGFINKSRIGIEGHSWGGYLVNHLITKTNLFRAAVVEAGISDKISGYSDIRESIGITNAEFYEFGQQRMGVPPWKNLSGYIANSPLLSVEQIQTPYLLCHNDADKSVKLTQGLEFFLALNRCEKEAYMFVYNGEGHTLSKKMNREHWAIHRDEFLNHYLMNKESPDWMEHPVPYVKRGERDVSNYFENNNQ